MESLPTALISDRHRELYRHYYERHQLQIYPRPNHWLPRIEQIAVVLNAQSVLDYGCGAARGLSPYCSVPVVDYDPGVPGCDALPRPCDLVVSIHMLEHVEPEKLGAVLDHMRSLALKAWLVVVSLEASTKVLPDGSPWHSLVREADWWRDRLPGFTPVPTLKSPDKEFAALYRVQ